MSHIFSTSAMKNVRLYGNVWGRAIDYDFNFTVVVWRRAVTITRRSAKSFLGRHGGGWNVRVGFQAGSWAGFFLLRDTLWSFGATCVRFTHLSGSGSDDA